MTRRYLLWASLALGIVVLSLVVREYGSRFGGRSPGSTGLELSRGSETFFSVFYRDELSEYCSSPSPKDADDPIGRTIRDATCSPDGWALIEVDLRGTGARDFIVSARNLGFCGVSGHCAHYVYVQTAGGYEKVHFRWAGGMESDEFHGHGLAPTQRRVRGYLVLAGLLKEYGDDGPRLESVEVVWDGSAYVVGGVEG